MLVFSLSTPRKHIGRLEVRLHSFLTSAVGGDERLLHAPGALLSGNNPGTQRAGVWLGLRIVMDVLEKRQIFCLYRQSNPGPCSQ